MRRVLALTTLVALSALATTARAQSSANFAGTWTVIADPNAPAPGRGGGGLLGEGATITQDAKVLTITRTTQNGEVKTMYNLDGSESKNSTMGRGGQAMETTSLGKWDGKKYVITTSQTFNGNAFTTTTSMWIDAAGNLVVESQRPGRGGGAPTTTTMTYKKS